MSITPGHDAGLAFPKARRRLAASPATEATPALQATQTPAKGKRRTRGTDLPIVFHKRPRCPKCDAIRFLTQRSNRDQGDGTTMRRELCLTCGHQFELVLE